MLVLWGWRLLGTAGAIGRYAAVANAALDAGINFFDTAEGYNNGRSEEALAVALKDRRHEGGYRYEGQQTRSRHDTGTL